MSDLVEECPAESVTVRVCVSGPVRYPEELIRVPEEERPVDMKPRVVVLCQHAVGAPVGHPDYGEIHARLCAVHRLDGRPVARGEPVNTRDVLVRRLGDVHPYGIPAVGRHEPEAHGGGFLPRFRVALRQNAGLVGFEVRKRHRAHARFICAEECNRLRIRRPPVRVVMVAGYLFPVHPGEPPVQRCPGSVTRQTMFGFPVNIACVDVVSPDVCEAASVGGYSRGNLFSFRLRDAFKP